MSLRYTGATGEIMSPQLKIFETSELLALAVARELHTFISSQRNANREISIVLSGGSTPRLLFREIVKVNDKKPLPWEHVILFWGDERCVSPEDPESNYGMSRKELLDHIKIPESNIIRMRGEENPQKEAERYSAEILKKLGPGDNGMPVFDWVFLGLGTDGHTASLFPRSAALEVDDRICVATHHPESGQARLTLTLPVLNNARRISFLVAGSEKRAIANEIFRRKAGYKSYPASRIKSHHGTLEWFLDRSAASGLEAS